MAVPGNAFGQGWEAFQIQIAAGVRYSYIYSGKIRTAFKSGTRIDRLYIQEGEKKAEKACKHGIPSIAVSGIQNLGNNGSLPEDFVRIVTGCQVREVAFVFDSDWDDISSNIKINDPVEKRPRNFYSAARNFKEYMRSLKNRDIYLEIFVGHIRKMMQGTRGLMTCWPILFWEKRTSWPRILIMPVMIRRVPASM